MQTVDIEPGNPSMFWSASEDGSVRQFDLRLSNQREHESPNVLLTAQKGSGTMELLAAKLNKVPTVLVLQPFNSFERVLLKVNRQLGILALRSISLRAESFLTATCQMPSCPVAVSRKGWGQTVSLCSQGFLKRAKLLQ